jgi:hypothetical protein
MSRPGDVPGKLLVSDRKEGISRSNPLCIGQVGELRVAAIFVNTWQRTKYGRCILSLGNHEPL